MSMINQPSYKHASLFADSEGKLSENTIEREQKKIGDLGITAYLRNWGVVNAVKQEKARCPYSEQNDVERVVSIVNPARTGIWNEKGEFQADVFDELVKKHAETHDDGSKIITLSAMHKFRIERAGTGTHGNLTHIAYIIPVPFSKVSDGSIDAFFDLFGDITEAGEKALSVDKLRTFYESGEWPESQS